MAIDNKHFFGGLNSDDEDRVIPNGDYRYALNIRNSKSDSDSQGSIENTKGDELVSVYLGAGNYKTIGAYDDKLNNKVYYFVWSSLGSHSIYEYNAETNSVALVMFGAALDFQEDRLIIEQNIAIIDGLMYWVNVKPYKINIAKAKSGLISGLNEQDILAVKPAPSFPPTALYGSDSNVKTNNLRGKVVQFRYKWVYDDNEESAWSPISKIPLPYDEPSYRPFSYYPTTINNYLDVKVNTGSDRVKRIKVAFRQSNIGDFYLAEDIDREKLSLSLSNTDYTFKFYNNESYISLDNNGSEGMRLFDWMPLESNTQNLIDGNRIAYGGITEGFDPVDVDIDIKPNYGEIADVPAPPVGGYSFDQSAAPTGIMYELQSNGNTLFDNSFVTTANPVINIVNGNSYRLTRYRNYWGSGIEAYYSPQSSQDANIVWWDENNGGNTTGNRTVQAIMNEWGFDRPVPYAQGVRYIFNINVIFYDFGNKTYDNKTFTVQHTSTATDDAYTIGLSLKQQIEGLYHDGDYIRIRFTNVEVGDYILGLQPNYGGLTTGSNSQKIKFTVIGYCPQPKTGGNGVDAQWGSPIAYAGDMPSLFNVTSNLKTYSSWTAESRKSLKAGATHGIGIVYYDFANRSGLTNIPYLANQKLFYVPHFMERGIPSGYFSTPIGVDIFINHLPPDWATHYQIVYTGNQTCAYQPSAYQGFIQCKLNNVANSSTPGATQATLNELSVFNSSTPEVTGLVYGFTAGDRIRFISDVNSDFLPAYEDVEIISYNSATETITFKTPLISVSTGMLVEIYTPKIQTTETPYYEIGEVFSIVNGVHSGSSQDQSIDANGLVVNPAIVELREVGDVYLRYRLTTDRQIEDYSFSDFYDSDSWDKGRPNIVDNNIKRTYRPTTIRYSQPFIPETNINGLSRFDDFDFEAYDQQYGDIRLLYSADRVLNVFQRLKVGRVGISQSTIYSADGTSAAVSRVDKVLNEIIYYIGEYGIGNNPESFAVYGNSKYFVDAKRGVVCRLGGDGITPISEYKMHNYFNDVLMLLDNSNKPYSIKGVYDVRFDEYIIHLLSEDVDVAIAFSEQKNRWVTYYSYTPDFMVSNGVGLLRFKDGQLYKTNTNSQYNNFLGLQYNSQIKLLSNVEPNKIKLFTNITQDATSVWNMVEATNQYGQKTSLLESDFEDVEGVYKASLLRDENTPNVALPLIEGDEMRSHSLAITLENDSTDFSKLFSVGVGVTLSELTNR